jgi:hypothetical protein
MLAHRNAHLFEGWLLRTREPQKVNGLVKSRQPSVNVIPAKAGMTIDGLFTASSTVCGSTFQGACLCCI